MFDVKIRKTYLIIAFIIVEVTAMYFWNKDFERDMQQYYNQKTKEVSSAFSVSQNSFRLVADIYFDQVIEQKATSEILKKAITATDAEKDVLRNELHAKLKSTFKNLQYRGFKRLNFYLADNETFLKFHKPYEFGAIASEKQAGVQKARATKSFVQGFEESRYFHGFRYIFPLFDQERNYLGCVEIGIGFNTIREQMMQVKRINYGYVIKKSVVGNAVFREINTNYLQSDINLKYLYETSIFNNAQRIFADRVDFEIRRKLNEILQIIGYNTITTGKAYARSIPYKGKFYSVALIPIRNIANKNIAYLIGYSSDIQFKLLESQFHLRIAGTTLALLVIIGFIYFENRNIRHIRIQNREMKLKARELRKSNNTKEKFLSFVAEDLNNPFHFIKGYSLALIEKLDSTPRNRQMEYLTIINQAADNGHHLIENLLEWSRIQKEGAEFNPDYYFLSDVIDDIMESNYMFAKQKKLSLYSKVVRKETNKVYADRENLTSIFRNLISNAIKYTQQGGTVKIYSQNRDDLLEVCVEDNGIGIKPESLRMLFATGKDTSETDGRTTAKLGLILTKELIERNGGKLEVISKVGKGTKFTFLLPTDKTYKLFNR